MNAILPEDLEGPTISSMSIGESAWTVPWAMWVDKDRRCWLNPEYSTHDSIGGTVTMRIYRREDGYEVRVGNVGVFNWAPTDRPGYVGQDGGNEWLPVVQMVR